MKRSHPLGCALTLAVALGTRPAPAQEPKPAPDEPIEVNAGPTPPEQAPIEVNAAPAPSPAVWTN